MTGVKPPPGDTPGFASRWSRLKQEANDPPAELKPVAEPEPEAEAEVPDDRTDEEVLEELGLPDPETLKSGDNFAAFMAKAVPARLRNRALRKLWISDPVFANLDMLIDYGDDFTDAATVIENLQTAYQVGRGFVDRVAELPEEEAATAEEDAEEQVGEKVEEQADGSVAEAGEDGTGETAGEAVGDFADHRADFGAEPARGYAPERSVEWSSQEPKTSARQRMRFRMAEE